MESSPLSRCTAPLSSLHRRHFNGDLVTETAHRLPDPHLTHHVRLFRVVHHDGLQPTQHTVVRSPSPQSGSEGPIFISRPASHRGSPTSDEHTSELQSLR